MQPITNEDAREMGVPECFSEEFAYQERTGTLPPYAGPVERDWGSDAYDPFGDEPSWGPDHEEPSEPPDFGESPDPEWVREPPEELKVMPTGREGHHPWCDVDHAPEPDHCPPPF
ncbi:hypothetical protein ACPCSE_29385 [Streptomyces cellulosae]